MILTLEVIGEQAEDLGAGGRKVFNAIGGTIGRLPDNDWVFPDPYVSGRHALIRYVSGKYFVEDTSTNGVFVNTPDNRLAAQRVAPAAQGRRGLHRRLSDQGLDREGSGSGRARNDPFAQLQARGKARHEADSAAASAGGNQEDRTENMREAAPRGGEESTPKARGGSA